MQDKDQRYFVVGNAHYADSLNSIIDHFKTHPLNDEGTAIAPLPLFARFGQCNLTSFFPSGDKLTIACGQSDPDNLDYSDLI